MEKTKFTSPVEEIAYWKSQASDYKERYEEVKEELEEFQCSSQELEAELEAALEQTEGKNKDLNAAKCRLEMEVDSLREKLETLQTTSHKQFQEVEDDLAQVRSHRDELIRYIRELEQSNDDLERAKRATLTSLEDFESRLNSMIERNAFLESELDEKETLAITVQRLKDEARDLRSEVSVVTHKSPSAETTPIKMRSPETEKMDSVVQTNIVDSNKLAEEMGITAQTPKSALLNHTGGNTPLTPSARISALNIVGDLLRKVGALENKLASCRNFVNNQQPRKASVAANSPSNSPRAKRLHRGSGSLQSDVSTSSRAAQQQQIPYNNVKITI